ncbi:MAG TPA: sugar phosphate isomerase/epimerase family protein [Candidatus Paceibacterota bacterium]|nr:sugar phosphate isomerase/epimerase [Verrucomicrobiota bacterium]HOX02562.1 sugar phosphate isomerase/epimerase family protein [Verrucomicrobiota bacterium]HRZ45238.1 sugar phosphate isomerase/epimerase family protein [Candidatus Paceibacterota bacterium]HRZ91781.1 sugar phosphate isomerase/epimerase family protein [Candidatus Paceibacterota bacterium]
MNTTIASDRAAGCVCDSTGLASRRGFLRAVAAAGVAAGLGAPVLRGAEAGPGGRRRILVVFSKVHHNELGMDYRQTADSAAEAGFDGIDCPVRPGGQVLPERVEEDLPRLAAILKERGLCLPKITTHITDLESAHAEKVLRVAARLGIRHYRLGTFTLPDRRAVPARLREIQARFRDLAALNRELGIQGLFQNHSGGNVGAEVWDAFETVRGYGASDLALAFDIGHATAVLGDGWHAVLQLVRSHIGVVYVKDHHRASRKWVALGEGDVDRRFFAVLKQMGYEGIFSQHFEYAVPGAKGPELARNLQQAMRRDQETLRRWLAEA